MRLNIIHFVLLLNFGIIACTAPKSREAQVSSATIYFGGDIVTMVGDSAEYVGALVVQDGKIAFVGSEQDARAKFGSDLTEIDLKGNTLLPGFIDAHGHIFNTGIQALAANLLPAPDGKANDIHTVIDLLKGWKSANQATVDQLGWIIGFGYDDSQLDELRHPTAEDLDSVSTEIPVVIIHQSGHLASMNNKGLQLMRYGAGVKNPPGGIIRRKEGTDIPNGVLEEMAFFMPLYKIMGSLDSEANQRIALAGQDLYKTFGFTTAQEGRASKDAAEIWSLLGEKGQIDIDVTIYPDIQAEFDYMNSTGVSASYKNHVRVAGVKMSLDGSPQGKTAWLTKPYRVPPQGQGKEYIGYPAIQDDSVVYSFVKETFKNNWQILAHCNGDAAADQFIRAVANATATYGKADRRPVMIHAQTVTDEQLDKMKELGIIPSFFGMHTFYWGDWHVDQVLGEERAFRISPAATAKKKGMVFTQHHDSPVILPNSIMILHTVVNRSSRSGRVIGEAERITPYDALKSITDWAAYQHFEENEKGTLEVGKLADLVLLDRNPIKVPAESIKEIKVLETIKDGKSVYRLEQ